MTEAIDEFKYKVLLAKLETLKGLKKPVHDFIKLVYDMSNNLKRYNVKGEEHPQTQVHAFILITKAMTYDGSASPIRKGITNSVEATARNLFKLSQVTLDNVQEVFQFYKSRIHLSPSNLAEFYKISDLFDVLKPTSFNVSNWDIKEAKIFSNTDAVAQLYLKNHNPNAFLLQDYFKCKDSKLEKAKQQLSEFNTTLTNLLRDIT